MNSVNARKKAISINATALVDVSCRPMVIIPSVDVQTDSDSNF